MSRADDRYPSAVGTDLTVVCCVESGPLEHQTVRLVESLRRWGGRFRLAPVIAVTPRAGPPLLASTRRALQRLDVDHVQSRRRSPYLWQHYMNKPLALLVADELAQTSTMAWFDSDIVVVDEPNELALEPGTDFAACARDRGGIGSSGPGDSNEPYWEHACRVAGIELDSLPWVRTEEEGDLIRMYWNSGLFVFRRAAGLTTDYHRLNVDLLDARVGTIRNKLQYNDQVALGLSVARRRLTWRTLSHTHNFGVSRWHPPSGDLANARVVHYHDSLNPDFFPEFASRMESQLPEVGAWLRSLGPVPRGGPARAASRQLLRAARSVRRHWFYRQCQWV